MKNSDSIHATATETMSNSADKMGRAISKGAVTSATLVFTLASAIFWVARKVAATPYKICIFYWVAAVSLILEKVTVANANIKVADVTAPLQVNT